MGWYTVAVQSPQLCTGELLSLRSTSSIQVHIDHSMFSLISVHMIVALKEQNVDMLSALLLTKGQSFSLHKDVKVRDCPLEISQILDTSFLCSFLFLPVHREVLVSFLFFKGRL